MLQSLFSPQRLFRNHSFAHKSIGHYYCSEKLGLAYVRIPKCACTTIERWMARHHDTFQAHPNLPIHSEEANQRYFDKVVAELPPLEDYFRFSFVRHPEDRFLSFFNDKLARGKPEKPLLKRLEAFGLYHGMPLKKSLEVLAEQPDTSLFNPHFAPQHHFLFDGARLRVDFIGHMENFSAGTTVLQTISNSDIPFPYSNKNPTPKSPLRKSEQSLLRKIYKRDFELLGYKPRKHNS
ncbi:sulfotransferase family protein [Gilvimarinus agarilyticus]|uniref:sulfotransferase family protein n=1 Tax=Gilvimarinus agarilyticus TaxID=679259 RepID=UPI0009FFE9BF|nr:sulfotransferase family protein [Gilvimarinus agarilyticus]